MPEGYSPRPEIQVAPQPEREHFRFRKAAAIAVGAGVLFVPVACTDSAEHPAPETSTTATTSTTLPENAHYVEHSTDYYGEIDKEDSTPLLGDPSELGYGLDEFGDPDVDYHMIEDGPMQGKSYLPLAEITKGEDGLILKDVSPLGLPEDTMAWLGDRFLNQSEMVNESLESGSTKKYIFALQDDNYDDSSRPMDTGYISGFYNSDEHQVIIPISTHTTIIDPENFEQTLVHESAHGLFGDSPASSFNAEKLDTTTKTEFMQACSDLRMQALRDTSGQIYDVQTKLDGWIATQTDPAMKARTQALREAMNDTAWWKAAAQNWPDDKLGECTVQGLGFINRNMGEQLGLAQPSKETKANDAELDAYYEADDALANLLRESTIYSVLTEGSYFYDAPLMGHPEDGIDETAASATNLIISFPDDMALKLKYLPEDQQQVVVRVIRDVVDQIVEHHPHLRGYLAKKEAYFLDQLHS